MSSTHDCCNDILYRGFKGLAYLIIFACIFSCHDNIDVYNRPGFDVGTRPSTGNPSQVMPPNFAQPPAYAPMSQQAPVQAAPAFRPAPDYYYYQPYYPQYQRPASRYYNNPYSFQPPAQYPYYDTDQYYVPPAAYNPAVENEPNTQGPAFNAVGGPRGGSGTGNTSR